MSSWCIGCTMQMHNFFSSSFEFISLVSTIFVFAFINSRPRRKKKGNTHTYRKWERHAHINPNVEFLIRICEPHEKTIWTAAFTHKKRRDWMRWILMSSHARWKEINIYLDTSVCYVCVIHCHSYLLSSFVSDFVLKHKAFAAKTQSQTNAYGIKNWVFIQSTLFCERQKRHNTEWKQIKMLDIFHMLCACDCEWIRCDWLNGWLSNTFLFVWNLKPEAPKKGCFNWM